MKRKENIIIYLQTGLIAVTILVSIIISCVLAVYMVDLSHLVANQEGYESIQFMRLPVLISIESVIILFIIACLLALPFLVLIAQDQVYSRKGDILLRLMGSCFLLMAIPCIGLIFYTDAHVDGSITNLYVMLGLVISFIIANLMFLFANSLRRGQRYKEENDLTV